MEKQSYSYTRQHLSSILDHVVNDSNPLCITRQNGDEIVMIEKGEYDSLLETAYLLRSHKNAEQLFKAMNESKQSLGVKVEL